jgi:endonuclease YncB( thermonuclease family)
MYWPQSLRRALHWSALFALWFLLSWPAVADDCLPFQADEWVRVAHVYDGDTVKLIDGRKVRFIGINTPEIGYGDQSSEPLAREARKALKQLLEKSDEIALRYDAEKEDRYHRLLAHVYLKDQTSVQQVLLEKGLAVAIAISPNIMNQSCYYAAEAVARNVGLGLWQQPRYQGIAATALSRDASGFYIIKGRVERIGESKKSLWLNLPARVAARIDKQDLLHFKDIIDVHTLKGRLVKLRGWLYQRRGELQMRIYHPSALELIKE